MYNRKEGYVRSSVDLHGWNEQNTKEWLEALKTEANSSDQAMIVTIVCGGGTLTIAQVILEWIDANTTYGLVKGHSKVE